MLSRFQDRSVSRQDNGGIYSGVDSSAGWTLVRKKFNGEMSGLKQPRRDDAKSDGVQRNAARKHGLKSFWMRQHRRTKRLFQLPPPVSPGLFHPPELWIKPTGFRRIDLRRPLKQQRPAIKTNLKWKQPTNPVAGTATQLHFQIQFEAGDSILNDVVTCFLLSSGTVSQFWKCWLRPMKYSGVEPALERFKMVPSWIHAEL